MLCVSIRSHIWKIPLINFIKRSLQLFQHIEDFCIWCILSVLDIFMNFFCEMLFSLKIYYSAREFSIKCKQDETTEMVSVLQFVKTEFLFWLMNSVNIVQMFQKE